MLCFFKQFQYEVILLKKNGLIKVLYCFWFLAGDFNISDILKNIYIISNFSIIHSLDLCLPKSVGGYKFLNLYYVIFFFNGEIKRKEMLIVKKIIIRPKINIYILN